jgi:hypothetical protein
MYLAGCATDAIQVSEAALTDRAEARVTGWSAAEPPRLVFSPEDEEVTLKVLFEFNYRGVYEWYKVEWVAPDGIPYKVVTLRTDFGSHRDLKASLKIRGKMASRMPGLWRVRIWLRGREGAPDELLVARLFRILEPDAAVLARGMTPVDAPAPDGERPLAAAAAPGAGPVPASSPRAAAVPAIDPVAVASDAAPAPAPLRADGPTPGTAEASGAPSLPQGLLMPAGIEGVAAAPGSATPDAAKTPPPDSPPAARRGAEALETRPAQSGIAAISLEAKPSVASPRPRRAGPRIWKGCPPLYYPPGPGCVERAPEE